MPRPRNPVPTRKTTIDMPVSLDERLDIYVQATSRTRVSVITDALTEYLDKQENAVRAALAKVNRF